MNNSESFSGTSRLNGIDFMRTIAIIIMIVANSGPYLLNPPHPVWLRLVSSLAAPLFIFLSGYSFFISYRRGKNIKHKLTQAFYLLISAVLLDVMVWRILPFQTFDVLYLIAVSLFVNIIIHRLSFSIKAVIALIFLSGSFLLRKYFGYEFLNPDPMLNEVQWNEFGIMDLFQVKRFLIDGWFPLFPWLGFSVIGSLVAEKADLILKKKIIWKISGIVIFAVASIILISRGINQEERDGYLEIFYPPSLLYLIISFSFVLSIFCFSINLSSTGFPFLNFINLPGRYSLFAYILHAAIISYILDNFFQPTSGLLYAVEITGFILSCYLLVYLAESLSRKGAFRKIPGGIRSIFGLK